MVPEPVDVTGARQPPAVGAAVHHDGLQRRRGPQALTAVARADSPAGERLLADSVHIFVLPPSLAVLQERLERRGQDAPDVIARRLAGAVDEMRHWHEFDYVIINQDFATAIDDLAAIVRAARLKVARQRGRHARLLQALIEPDSP